MDVCLPAAGPTHPPHLANYINEEFPDPAPPLPAPPIEPLTSTHVALKTHIPEAAVCPTYK